WRTFEIVTRVEVIRPAGITRVWVPTPLMAHAPYQTGLANSFQAEGGAAKLVESNADGLGIVVAEFPQGTKPVAVVTSRAKVTGHSVDLSRAGSNGKPNQSELEHFLRPTKLMPTDGIVKETATQITAGSKSDVEKARAIYEWIVENTFRNPKTRGCGTGDIRFMLESKDLGGKCADLNAPYGGLARVAGLP